MAEGTPRPASYRETVWLPVGYEDPASSQIWQEAEVRAITGGDELSVGTSQDYNRHPNDLIYKNLMLARCVCRIGERALVTLDDIRRLQAADLRALEEAVFRLTYGESPDREVTCPDCKASITVPGSGVPPG